MITATNRPQIGHLRFEATYHAAERLKQRYPKYANKRLDKLRNIVCSLAASGIVIGEQQDKLFIVGRSAHQAAHLVFVARPKSAKKLLVLTVLTLEQAATCGVDLVMPLNW